jgi:LuxR family maltose regulon positive regulatory protein
LTKLLDESTARIKLLVAPAGYGKTTLAQQWLSVPERRDVWYRAGPAAADVAALAAGISLAVSEVIPDAGERMRRRIRAVGHPEEDVDVLAELFAEDVQEWPADAWLAIDDYQFAMESVASARFVESLTDQTPVQMLITSRLRPRWATPRRIMYGEIQEIERRTLAMDVAEASTVLGQAEKSVARFLEHAAGWPAIIGLAALNLPTPFQSGEPPTALHDYLAEEVISTSDPEIELRLATLALAGRFDTSLASALLGQHAAPTVEEGIRCGVFETDSPGGYQVHPLLSNFLETHLRADRDTARRTARKVAHSLLDYGRVDDAFALATRFEDAATAEHILGHSLDRLLRQGRVATVARWLEQKPLAHSASPVVFLAEAETEFRQGHHGRALELALQAVSRLSESPLQSRALVRAGHSALMAERPAEALDYFREAQATARTPAERREALMGCYIVSSEMGLEVASDHLEALIGVDDPSPETSLRTEVARLMQATRSGGVTAALDRALPFRRLVDGVADPLASTAFLHMLANALNLAARYDEAASVVDALIGAAKRYRMVMPLPHAGLNQALARHGKREFGAAHAALNSVGDYLQHPDVYLEYSVRALRVRILTSEGRLEESLREVTPDERIVLSPPLLAEYLASRALTLAAANQLGPARRCADQALDAYPNSVEARVIASCISAISEGTDSTALAGAAGAAWDIARETGNIDGIVCAYRAWPPLLNALFAVDPQVESVVIVARDVPLARRLGLRIRQRVPPSSVLTPREAEVFELLQSGLSNRKIAESLVISEATVKVHLRHIYEKLGVRTRAEALAHEFRR